MLRGASLISQGVSIVAGSRRLGHWGPKITYRVFAYLVPDDEAATRTAPASTLAKIIPEEYPMCTRERVR